MTDSIFDDLQSQQAPGGSDVPTAQPDMLAYANSQLSGGMSPDEAIQSTYAKYPTQSGVRFGLSNDGKSFKDLAAQDSSDSIFSDYDSSGNYTGPVQRKKIKYAPTDQDSTARKVGEAILGGVQTSILDPFQRAQGQITNFLTHAGQGDLSPQEGGTVTPEQKAAAKLIGADVGNDWGKILKMTPQQLAKYREDADRLVGLDPKEQAARDEAIARGEEYAGPWEGLLQHSAAKDLLSSIYNPNESNTLLYHKVNEVAHLMDIEQHPGKYSDDQVKSAKEILDQYRADVKKGTWQQIKESLAEIKKHPLALVNSTLADPELFLAPEVKLGTATYGAKATAAARAAEQAARYQKLAESISMAGKGIPDLETAATVNAAHYGQQADRLLKEAQSLRNKGFLADIGSAAGSGAAINAAIAAEQQMGQQGYVKKGSIEPAAAIGAGLGGGLAALDGRQSLHGDMASRVSEATTREAIPDGGPAAEPVPGPSHTPGEPLPANTPINKDSHVPYYGGVNADGRIIHIDKNTPEKLTLKTTDGTQKEVPVLKTVAYHEQVEYPLMHMEGPIKPATLLDLRSRMSAEDWAKIPKEVFKKLKEGKSLTYPEAHTYFATAAENHLVKTLYDVDPKVYQDSLKPYIKDVAKANKGADASDIPSGLDSKPYDDMGGTSSLKGAGNRPMVDQVEPGANKHSDNQVRGKKEIPVDTSLPLNDPKLVGPLIDRFNRGQGFLGKKLINGKVYKVLEVNNASGRKVYGIGDVGDPAIDLSGSYNKESGKIDPRLLATGVTAGAGAIAGGMAADKDNKLAGTIFGALAGAWIGHVMGMGDVGAAGLGKREGGMFGGRKMATHNPAEERLASRMEEMGKDPEQIHLATGMSKDFAGNWVKEIPDQGMQLLPRDHPNWQRATKEAIPLSTLVNHPELDKAYPGLMDKVKIKIDPELGSAGAFSPAHNTLILGNLDTLDKMAQKRPAMAPRSVIAHELQHAIQRLEGMPGGTSVAAETARLADVKDYLENRQEALYDKWLDAVNSGDDVAISRYDESLKNVSKQIDDIPNKAKDLYAREAGEVQARNVQTRLNMSDEARSAKSPRQTEDVPLRNQRGNIDPELLKKLGKTAALGTIGATLGATYLDPENKVKGALAGAALALVGGEIKWNKLYPSFKEIQAKDPRFNVNDVLDNWDHQRAASQRTTFQVQRWVYDLAKDKSSRVKITHWLDGDKSIPLTDKEYKAAKLARQFYDSLGQAAQDTGVLKDFLQDYVNHEWGDNAKAKALQDQIESTITTNMSPKDRHALARKFLTIQQGKAAGLIPKSEDIIELMGMYSNSMSRAMANKTLLDSLKAKTLDTKGEVKAIMGAGKAPFNYVPINHPQLNNVRVHPSIAPSLDFLFHTYKKGGLINAFESFNTATKRMQVSFSLFHVKALIDAYLGANTLSGTFRNLYDIATASAGKSEFHKQYQAGGQGDIVDKALQAGLKVDMGHVSSQDVNASALYDALDRTTAFLNNIIPGAGKAPELIKKVNKASDKFIWENVHTGLKGMTFMNVYERLQRSWAKEAMNNPTARIPSNEDLAKAAASFTNDTFGGLNWRRLADDAQTKWGRSLALSLASPAGRRLSQVLLFAPDWTYSTIRSFVKGLGEGSGVKGLLQPKTLADLHRQYVIRSAFIYLTLYNAVNMAMSGHPIWDNKDPLMLDMGNGEKIQANKHFLEVPHMLMNPAKFALGKLGTVPSELLDQVFHREYLTPEGGPPMQSGRLEHAASRLLPFSLEPGSDKGTPERVMSALGFPVYGTTEEEKKRQKKERQKKRAKKEKETF